MHDKKIIMLNLRDFCTKNNKNATKHVKCDSNLVTTNVITCDNGGGIDPSVIME